jgi:hypothetical protein
MVSLTLGHNNFTGSLPEDLFKAHMITYLDISHNK